MKENKEKVDINNIKKWIKKHTPVLCISAAVFAVLVAVLLMVFQAKEELEQYTIGYNDLYTYFNNHRMEFYTEVTLNNEGDVTKMLYNGEELELVSEPIYFNGQKKVVFPSRMSVVFPYVDGNQKKINRFTQIDAEGMQPIVSNIDLKYALTDAFIYDGYDVYFFLEKGTISYGDKEIEITPLSFVRSEYDGILAVYNYENNEMIYEEKVSGNVVANFGGYSINMINDTVEIDGKSILLSKNIDTQPLLMNK